MTWATRRRRLAVGRPDGQAWGFPACYGQGGSACAGAPTPVAVLDKHAAVSGVAIVTGGLGASRGPSALVAEWATGVVLRVALTHDGTTYTGTVEPFLTGLTQPVPVVTARGRLGLRRRLGDGHRLSDRGGLSAVPSRFSRALLAAGAGAHPPGAR